MTKSLIYCEVIKYLHSNQFFLIIFPFYFQYVFIILFYFLQCLSFCVCCFSLFLQTLDYETKKSYSFKVEASNAQLDPRFLHLGPFKDSATVKVSVLDLEEPPVFTKASYYMDVFEDTLPGTIIGSVTAQDLDVSSSAVR